MFEVSIGRFNSKNQSDISAIRTQVFTHEQGVDPKIDFDGLDPDATHALVMLDNTPVATGRVLADGHIGRIAVLKEFRNKGLGAKVVLLLIEYAQKKHLNRVYLGAQKHAIEFYTKLGFTPYGEEYIEADILHQSMELKLSQQI